MLIRSLSGRELVCGIVFAVKGPVIGLYKITPDVALYADRALIILALCIFIRSQNMILIVGMLRSGGDTRYSLFLTRTSRNQKGRGKVAQGVTCQRQEKGEKREAYPTATFPRAYCSRMWLECSIHLQRLELSHGRTAI